MEIKRVETIPNRLHELLRVKEMTATELCNKTGISPPVMSRYINGNREPRQDKLAIIAEVCNVSPAWLLGFDCPMNSPKSSDKQEEERALDQWRRLSAYHQKIVLDLMENLNKKG